MTNRASLRTTGAVLLLGISVRAAAATQAREPFEAELARLAGREAQQCSIFRLGQEAKAGWACAQAAERAGRSYWIAFEGMGDDSLVGRAAIRTPAGAHILLDDDSSPFGSGVYPRFLMETCPWPISYDPAARLPFDCQAPRPER